MMASFVLPQLPYRDVFVALLVVLLGLPFVYMVQTVLWKWYGSWRARRIFEAQGIKCLPRHFFYGNLLQSTAMLVKARSQPMPRISHDLGPRIFPHLCAWSKKYGEHFVFWVGFQPQYVLKEPEQARELLSTKSGQFIKFKGRPDAKDLLGDGLVSLNGEKWSQHRRILNNAFLLDKLKAMTPTMVMLTDEMMRTWESCVEGKEAINVAEEFRKLTCDIIAHTAFGSNFAEGKLAFELQHTQQVLVSELTLSPYIPGTRFLPLPQNRYRNSLKRGIHQVLSKIIKKRMELSERGHGDVYGSDLLGLMLAANKGELRGNQRNLSMGLDELIDECKTFFFAGHETTAALLSFMSLLLANHPDWQERLREEVFEACGKSDLPTAESLNHLKLVGMVIHETLRLYPPANLVVRETDNDVKLGGILVPAGTAITVPTLLWHLDERFWGPNAKEFHPERFKEGISKACKVSGAYLPFSFGPRSCIGQQFTTIEAKMVVATILQRYRFCLSPEYVHAPTTVLTLQPQFGMPIIFEKLS